MKRSGSCRQSRGRSMYIGLTAAFLVLFMAIAGTVTAAEVSDSETYRLEEGVTVTDDLVVFGREIIIDGTVEGDLVAFGQSIIVNGRVTQDLIAAGAEVIVNGVVDDDVRAAGGSVVIVGRVGDDLFAAGGAAIPGIGPIPFSTGGRTIQGGLSTGPSASIGGDAYIAGGLGTLEGQYRNDLFAAIGELVFDARVDGNAVLQSERLTFGESAFVAGDLEYAASQSSGEAAAGGVITATTIEDASAEDAAPASQPLRGFGWWLLRTSLMLAGVALVGALVLSLSPRTVTGPADAIAQQTMMAILWGVLIAVAAVPFSSAFVLIAVLFFGWFWGGVAAFAFLFGLLLLAWVLSPVISGLWLGRLVFSALKLERSDTWALVAGAAAIVIAGRILGAIPCVGALAYLMVYTLSFALAVGGVILQRQNRKGAASLPAEAGAASDLQ